MTFAVIRLCETPCGNAFILLAMTSLCTVIASVAWRPCLRLPRPARGLAMTYFIKRHSEPLAKNLPEGWFSVCIKPYSRNFYFSKVLRVRRSLFSVVFVGGVGGLFAVFRSGDFLRNVLHKVSNRHYYADNREHRDEPLPKYG